MATASVSAATEPPSPTNTAPASPTLSSSAHHHEAPGATERGEGTVVRPKIVSYGENENAGTSRNDPLPADMRRILTEVAQTGSCAWMSWNGEETVDQSSRTTPEAGSYADPAPSVVSTAAASRQLVPAASGSRNFLTQLRNGYSASPASYQSAPPSAARKKYRNGLHVNRRRYSSENGATKTITMGSLSGGRKRPLHLTRTPSSSTVSVAGSVGSAGSEPDDSTYYECDSEGTTTTTNSEVSMGERREQRRRLATLQASSTSPSTRPSSVPLVCGCKTLRAVFGLALGRVLDHYYHHRGGYKLSPAEIRINEAAVAALKAGATENGANPVHKDDDVDDQSIEVPVPSAETIYYQRRKRLLGRFGTEDNRLSGEQKAVDGVGKKPPARNADVDGPPFTIQRIAEVLVAPEKYYTQTHKLCNCLEKLLLVTSSANAFGGIGGGSSSQNRRETREFSALAGERGRVDIEHRNRRLRRKLSSSSSEEAAMDLDKKVVARKSSSEKARSPVVKATDHGKGTSPRGDETGGSLASTVTREQLEAAAKASLRHKFDHIGHDPHGIDRDPRNPNRGITTSPPPPSLGLIGPATMPGHSFVRHLSEHSPGVGESSPETHSLLPHGQRPPSPILFAEADRGSPTNTGLHPNPSMHLLQLHQAAVLAGVSLGSAPRNLVIDPATGSGRPAGETADVETERSSASNSDLDSGSDDFSLDDSASDRSDGSDNGSGNPSHYEPFTAARVMALNRMQQQQRLQQSRTGAPASGLHLGEGYRPPADSDYQSGDSIDSTLAEDSCGSDSSSVSSDIAD